MIGKRIEHGPYDIETPSYDIGTGLYEQTCPRIHERPRGAWVFLWGAPNGAVT